MKKLFSFCCMLLVFACNKNSNELKPSKLIPITQTISGKLNDETFIESNVEIYKGTDLTEIYTKSIYKQINMIGVKSFLIFEEGLGYKYDSLIYREFDSDTSRISKNVEDSEYYSINNKYIVITQISDLALPNKSSLGHFFKSGTYSLLTDTSLVPSIGKCRGFIASDGKFKLWLKSTNGQNDVISGQYISNDTICQECYFLNQTGTKQCDLQLKQIQPLQYFNNSTIKLNFILEDKTNTSIIKTVEFSLNK